MCGIVGIINKEKEKSLDPVVLQAMTDVLRHRGPDQTSLYIDKNIGLGFQRLSIIDLANGQQPFYAADENLILICNGEIYNYKELRSDLTKYGFNFKTNCDIEVLLPMYQHFGLGFLEKLNGQFAIALVDKISNRIVLARDQFGICPLFYSLGSEGLIFGSEVKAILEHPTVTREVNLTGLDQVFSFPGLVSPASMFKDVQSIKPGHYLIYDFNRAIEKEYWDIAFQDGKLSPSKKEENYIDELESLLLSSVKYRINADVPVGFYLSGGLDSSLIGSLMAKVSNGESFSSFSVSFDEEENSDIDEGHFQEIVASHIKSKHHRIKYDWKKIEENFRQMIYFSECPLKETYNTCSMSLSKAARDNNVKVILSGEGADEIFAGYVGYRFDLQRKKNPNDTSLMALLEKQEQHILWGDPDFFYEKNYYEFTDIKKSLYAEHVNERFNDFNSHRNLAINRERLKGISMLSKRSYLDIKLRLSDHLVADHCDRTCYANSIEGRYPFLDTRIMDFAVNLPDHMKLNGVTEKYILKKIATKYLPSQIVTRQKQGFVAPGSPYLLKQNIEWIQEYLSSSFIRKTGYFDPMAIERLKKMYSKPGFKLNLPYDSDLLIIVLTFNVFLDVFNVPNFG